MTTLIFSWMMIFLSGAIIGWLITATYYDVKRKRETGEVEKPFTIYREVLREIVRMGRQKEFLSLY